LQKGHRIFLNIQAPGLFTVNNKNEKMIMSKILITGATGKLGSAVVNELVEKQGPANVSVLVRDPSKAAALKEKGVELVQGDYNDYQSLVKAFQGVDKLYFVSSSEIANRSQHHENVVKAATEAKVGHIIYTSFQRKTDDDSSPVAFVAAAHVLAENLIKESGLKFTLMKHALYADILPMFMGDQVLNSGVIFLPAGDGKASYTSRGDMASAGVAVLTSEGHDNKTYEISVDKSYSLTDIAAILTELSGKPVNYAAPDAETFTAALTQAGVPAQGILFPVSFCTAINQGEFDFPNTTLEKLIGRKPESIKDFLKKVYVPGLPS
jgi:NAD(P)H dehydrogenase (quinone)